MITKGMVVQFLENHKWAGSLGIVTEVKECGDDIRYMGTYSSTRNSLYFLNVLRITNDRIRNIST